MPRLTPRTWGVLIGAMTGLLLVAIGWLLSGAPIQRGPVALGAYLLCLLGVVVGGIAGNSHAQRFEDPAPAPAAPPAPQGVNLEAFERLKADVKTLENKVNGLSFLAGRMGRRGPPMPSAPEAPR